MKRILFLITAVFLFSITACKSTSSIKSDKAYTFNYQYLTKEECAGTLGSLDDYYGRVNQKSLNYFMQKKGSSVEEFREYSKEQAMDFSDEEKAFIDSVIFNLEEKMKAANIKLPVNKSISIALTTMKEANSATGYTHNTTVFLNKDRIHEYLTDISKYESTMEIIITHELFHCLTRNNPEFRKNMYKIINFTVTDSDFTIPDDIYEQIIINPDVAHHDSCAQFTINGEKKNCFLVFLCKNDFENPGDIFFKSMYTGLVDIESGTLYTVEDTSDFYDVVGNNTTYCEDPEECMASNFSYAVTFGADGINGENYKSPEIIEDIISYLQK